jgi:hypothetical protein
MNVWKQDPSLSERFGHLKKNNITPLKVKGRRAFSKVLTDNASLCRRANAIDRLSVGTERYAWRKDLIMRPPTRHYMLDAKLKKYRRKAENDRFETRLYRKFGFSTNPEHVYPHRSHKELYREAKDLDAEVWYDPQHSDESTRPHGIRAPYRWKRFDSRLNVSRKWMAQYKLLEYCKVRETGTKTLSRHELTRQVVSRRLNEEKMLAAISLVPE